MAGAVFKQFLERGADSAFVVGFTGTVMEQQFFISQSRQGRKIRQKFVFDFSLSHSHSYGSKLQPFDHASFESQSSDPP